MLYTVEITETLQRQIPVEASCPEEAVRQIKTQYKKSDIVLSAEDYVDTEFNVL